MQIRRAIGTLALAGGLFVGLVVPALAGDMGPSSAGPAGQMPVGKDGGPMPSGASPVGGPSGPAPSHMSPRRGPAPSSVPPGGGPLGAGPSSVVAGPARAGGLDPMTAGAALSGLGMLVL